MEKVRREEDSKACLLVVEPVCAHLDGRVFAV